MEKTFTKKVREEVGHHIGKIKEVDVARLSFDKIEVKKDLRLKFIRCGMVENPSTGHHFEYRFKDFEEANFTLNELLIFGIEGKISINEKRKNIILYIVDAKTIMEMLKLLGAKEALKDYEEIVDYKEKIKNTNRKVNFEAANIRKAANASLKQLEDIKKLLKKYNIDNLDTDLRKLVKARLKYKTLSLTELASKMGNVNKNILNHRFRKIRKMIGEKI